MIDHVIDPILAYAVALHAQTLEDALSLLFVAERDRIPGTFQAILRGVVGPTSLAKIGSLELLVLADQQVIVQHTASAIFTAVQYGHVRVIDWLKKMPPLSGQHELWKGLPLPIIEKGADVGRIGVIEWAINELGPDRVSPELLGSVSRAAFKAGQIHVLTYLVESGRYSDVLPLVLNGTCISTDNAVYEWLERTTTTPISILPQGVMPLAAARGSAAALKWYWRHCPPGFFLDFPLAAQVLIEGTKASTTSVLDWVWQTVDDEVRTEISTYDRFYCNYLGDREILEWWLAKRRAGLVSPSAYASVQPYYQRGPFGRAYFKAIHDPATLQWCWAKRAALGMTFRGNSDLITGLATRGYADALEWFWQRDRTDQTGFEAQSTAIEQASIHGSIQVLEWFWLRMPALFASVDLFNSIGTEPGPSAHLVLTWWLMKHRFEPKVIVPTMQSGSHQHVLQGFRSNWPAEALDWWLVMHRQHGWAFPSATELRAALFEAGIHPIMQLLRESWINSLHQK
ncbi:hypothetical protein BC828DRAFT_373715 [Blastocladiella britannica]|nr:hypothetical protein BC828DRAFT_373715 [Blastocladiella britannica]